MATTIPKSADTDPFYRYKRSLLKANAINSNGGTTQLLNLDDVAKQLERKPEEILQYFKKKLHVNAQQKKGVGYFIKAVVHVDKLETLLEEYIEQYVLCSHCNNPETDRDDKVLHCRACGVDTKLKMK